MARIIGVEVPPNKRIDIALRYIYGIGPVNALEILERANIDRSHPREGSDRAAAFPDRPRDSGGQVCHRGRPAPRTRHEPETAAGHPCYRGVRHQRSLPVRGQRTQTNARTRKGPRKTVGVQRNPNAKDRHPLNI